MRTLRNTRKPIGFNKDTDTYIADCTRKYNPDNQVIAVDFDGTLVHNEYPFIENPNMVLINFIKEHRHKYTWILWTCRHDEQLKYAIDYMRDEHGIVFDFVNENIPSQIEKYGDTRKIWANYYIDDKNLKPESVNIFLP